ncbi:hypothetical protein [Actinomadura roseirufa]|uniref:hypothetical protein n=1 Tax=Actinomadura roseirufa TaxID=2094049 RepID=UPI0010417337|nr:hypothetical protein [Actinomadura roseirufa]
MVNTTKLLRHLESHLEPDETVIAAVGGQLRGGIKKLLGKSLATGLVTGLATTALTGGVGVFAFFSPPPVWMVATSRRVLVFACASGSRKPGQLLFEAPREALKADMKLRVLYQVTLTERAEDRVIARFNFGLRKKAATQIVTGIGE